MRFHLVQIFTFILLILSVNARAADGQIDKDKASITPQYIVEAVEMLAVAMDMEAPEVYVIKDKRCGFACVDFDYSIVLSPNFFSLPHFEYELYVLAHEMGHIKLGHLDRHYKEYDKDTKKGEKDADILAVRTIKKTKYDACFASKVWLYWIEREGNQGGNTHPTYKERYEYSVQECKK